MPNLTNKNLDFLSDENLIKILQTILSEIENTVTSGAHRSTTYLAVSAIEGLMLELIKLLKLNSAQNANWPNDKNGNPITINKLTLENMIDILAFEKALPTEFDKLYHPVRNFRNYVHPGKELKELQPIKQSTSQIALACLNALIENYQQWRFVADQIWNVEYGLARVPNDKIIHFTPIMGEFMPLMTTQKTGGELKQITFRVIVPRYSIFNFVYNYISRHDFMAARIEGRVDPRERDNGRLVCNRWQSWFIDVRYTQEPDSSLQEHEVQITLQDTQQFAITVDGIQLTLENNKSWGFNPLGRVGFMTEGSPVSILDLQVTV